MNDVDSVKSTLQELPKQLNDILQQSKEYVTDFINGGFGGYVYYTGINGTFETAITRDRTTVL